MLADIYAMDGEGLNTASHVQGFWMAELWEVAKIKIFNNKNSKEIHTLRTV